MYEAERTRCAFLLSLLTAKALDWALAVWDIDPQMQTSFSYFVGLLCEVFEYPAGGKDISVQLLELRQGTDTAVNAIKFRTLAAQSRWNNAALLAVFHEALPPALQAELACHDTNTTLSS